MISMPPILRGSQPHLWRGLSARVEVQHVDRRFEMVGDVAEDCQGKADVAYQISQLLGSRY